MPEELGLLVTAALHGGAIPVAVTIIGLFLTEYAGRGRGEWLRHTGQALALGVGFLAGFVALAASGQLGWDFLKPADPWAWLPLLALLALAAGIVDRWPALPISARWGLRLAVAVLTASLLVRAESVVQPVHAGWTVGLVLAVLLLWGALDALMRRWPGAGLPALLALVAMAGALILFLAGILKYAQVAGVAAAVLAGSACLDWRRSASPSVQAGVPALAVLLPGLLFAAYFRMYSDVPLASFLLIPIAPVASAAVVTLPPLRNRQDRWPMVMTALTTVTLLAVAVVLAALA